MKKAMIQNPRQYSCNNSKTMKKTNVVFEQVKGNTWCLRATANIPVYFLDEKTVVLIDSGYPDERTRPILDELISSRGLKVRAAIGSHSHYDHLGNHSYLREKYGTEIILPEIEAAYARNYTMFQPLYPAHTRKELQDGFSYMIMKPDRVIPQLFNSFDPNESGEATTEKSGTCDNKDVTIEIDGAKFICKNLPGHTPGQMGFITPDDVFYLADAVMGIREFDLAKLPTVMDWEAYKNTQMSLMESKNAGYILAHGDIYDDIVPVLEHNLKGQDEKISRIKDILKTQPHWTLESIIAGIWDAFGMTTKNEFNRRVYARNVGTLVDYLVKTGFLSPHSEKGVVNFDVVD